MNDRTADAEPLDRLAGLFAADTILASQFAEMRKPAAGCRPIARLLLAVLADAIDCLIDLRDAYPQTKRGRLYAEAKRWIFAEAAAGPFSFAWICDGLALDPEYLRGGIRRLSGTEIDQIKRSGDAPKEDENRGK